MSTAKERLLLTMEEAGVSQAELSRRLDVSQQTVNSFINGSSDLWKMMIPAARALGVRAEWLQYGVGPRTHTDEIGKLEQRGLVTRGSKLLAAKESLSSGMVEINSTEYTSVPRYDAALSAGPGSIIEDRPDPLGYQLVETQWLRSITQAAPSELCVLRVDGDSMETTLHDRDWVLVDRTQNRINRPGIYALRVGDSAWIKRITLDLATKKVQVISDNPIYPVQILKEDELAIIGRIIFVVGRRIP